MAISANTAVDNTIKAASGAVVHPGGHAKSLSILGSDVIVFYRFDATEHARRQEISAKPLTALGHLETLLTLPVDMPVPLESLSAKERARVRKLPTGSVGRDHSSISRHAVRPLTVDLVVVRATQPRQGLEAATRFAPYCSRAVFLERSAPCMDDFLNEASFYEVGVLLNASSGPEMPVAPQPHRPKRHTAAAWSFVESLYQRVL